MKLNGGDETRGRTVKKNNEVEHETRGRTVKKNNKVRLHVSATGFWVNGRRRYSNPNFSVTVNMKMKKTSL